MTKDPIIASVSCGDIYAAQRRLRVELLDRSSIRHNPARDLAAHMLLSIDDLPSCWSIATEWLQSQLGCHRVDAGFGVPQAREYFPSFAEAKNSNYDIPSFGSSAVYNQDPVMQAMWLDERPIVFADIKQDRRVTHRLRKRMSGAKTKSKFGAALRSRNGSYGLICADWTEHLAPRKSTILDCFELTVADVLSPVIAIAKEFAEQNPSNRNIYQKDINNQKHFADDSAQYSDWMLTETETEVAKLIAQGLSYKEIAQIRERSFSTVDHQLRSIRKKAGVSSTSALISLLANSNISRR